MIKDWLARQALDSLWALIWHFGIISAVLVLALLALWFVPAGKKVSLWIATVAAVTLIVASIYTKLGANYVQAKWDAAKVQDAADATRAHDAAEASVPPVVPGAPTRRLPHDRNDRDNGPGNGASLPGHHLFKFKGHP